MSVFPRGYDRFNGGISDFTAESSVPDAYYFGQSIDVRTDPRQFTLLPRTIKESGSVITDLPKWLEIYNATLTAYIYGNTGNLYSRTSAGSYTFLRQVAASHGNGLVYSQEDNFLYYASDKTIGRYGSLSATTPTFTDDFFGSQGGVPLNTNSLDLESGSSQYADRADTATLSITGDLSIRAQIKPESLPAVGSSMTLVSKWNPNGNLRSYMLDIAGISGYFGDGSDGTLTISSDTTEAPIDSACTGTIATTSLSATNVSFTTGQIIFIHQSRGTGVGSWQRNTIASYTAGTITLGTALNATYTTGAQVRVLKQYTNVTINSGKTYSAKAWNGTVGGILSFIASGTVTIIGSIVANGSSNSGQTVANGGGYRGGIGGVLAGLFYGQSGEGTIGISAQVRVANGNGGGGGQNNGSTAGGGTPGSSGGGGSNGTSGTDGANGGSTDPNPSNGLGGDLSGATDLTTLTFGGGGGGGSVDIANNSGGAGGNGGGIIFIIGTTLVVTGAITATGGNGGTGVASGGGGAGGAGGSILLKSQVATLGANLITALGGSGGGGGTTGGDGGTGRVHLDYYTSYTGTTTPTLDVTQDNSLVTNTSYQLRLSLSSNGTNSETLAQVSMLQVASWQQVGVSWVSSTSTATFYLNGTALGTRTGAFTSIADTTARFAVGANFDSGGLAVNFYDGLIDEVQVYNRTQTTSDFSNSLQQQISTTTVGLQAYYKFNGTATDSTANANNLTLQNAPVYSSDVPFPSPTTRLDIDQQATTAGNTYTVPVAISESATNRLTFTPGKDPQKSVAVLVAAKGTGDWTVTVHDSFNNIMATSTITNANMTTGYVEFTYTALWSPLTNFTTSYHFHLTSTVADGTVTTGTASDLETVSYRTYYQFLTTNVAWHPMARFLQFWVVGNGKWLGKYEATLYEPNKIALGAGWSVRCLGYWGEYLAIGLTRDTANIYDTDRGRICFWDGFSPTYNYSIEIPEGGINSLYGTRDKLYIIAGYQNQLLEYSGGLQATKIKNLPLMEVTKYSEVFPQGMTMWRSLLRYGVSGNSNSIDIQRGVYTWGSTNIKYPEILTYDYPISTSSLGLTVSIGLVAVVNRRLLIGWQDGTGFGIDYVDPANAPFPTGYMSFLVDNEGNSWKEKRALTIAANFDALASGEAITTSYLLENSTTAISNLDTTSTGDVVLRQIVENGDYYNFQVRVDLSTSNASTAPTVQSVLLVSDLQESQQTYG